MTAAGAYEVPVQTSVPEEQGLRVIPREEQLQVVVLGKAKCGKCEAAKKKLTEYFKLPFHFLDVFDPPENWRDTDAAEVLADACVKDIDYTHPPIIGIRGVAFEYAAAMKELKQLTK